MPNWNFANIRETKVGALDSSIAEYVEVSNLDAETNTLDERLPGCPFPCSKLHYRGC
jgi:hypothetical protein